MRTFLRLFVLSLPTIALFVLACFVYGLKMAALLFAVCALIFAFIAGCVVLAEKI